ncbi:MAG: hypothetical protein ACJ0HH_02055 [Candidatus Thalassarchaeum sp.]
MFADALQMSSEAYREAKEDCPCRSKGVSANLFGLGKSMNDWGVSGEGDCGRQSDDWTWIFRNPALRDWPALRIQHTPHPMVGETFIEFWPLLDFQSAIEGPQNKESTHIVRGKDLMDSTRKQSLLYEKTRVGLS